MAGKQAQVVTSFLRDSLLVAFKPYGLIIVDALRKILTPCCNVAIDSIDFECTDPNTATITINLVEPVTFPGTISFNLSSPQDGNIGNGMFTSGDKTIVIENATITSGSDVEYTLVFYFLTSTEKSKGIFESATFITDNPDC